MKCPFCGNEIMNENASFCNMCGKKLPQSKNDYYDAMEKNGGSAEHGSSESHNSSYDSMSYEGSRDDSYERSQDEYYKDSYGKPGEGLYSDSYDRSGEGLYGKPYEGPYGSYERDRSHIPPTPSMKDRKQGNILKGVAIGLSIAIFCLAAFLIVNALLNNNRKNGGGQEAKKVETTTSKKADGGSDQQDDSKSDQSDEMSSTDLSSDEGEGEYDEADGGSETDEYEESGNDDVSEEDDKNYNFPDNVVEDPKTGHHYAFYNYNDEGLQPDFNAWEHFCERQGGHLATITSPEENDFIYQYLKDSGKKLAFFGYTDEESEGNWRWVTGEEVTFENWAPGQDNNGSTTKTKEPENYAQFSKDTLDGQWNDARVPQNSHLFICEWED